MHFLFASMTFLSDYFLFFAIYLFFFCGSLWYVLFFYLFFTCFFFIFRMSHEIIIARKMKQKLCKKVEEAPKKIGQKQQRSRLKKCIKKSIQIRRRQRCECIKISMSSRVSAAQLPTQHLLRSFRRGPTAHRVALQSLSWREACGMWCFSAVFYCCCSFFSAFLLVLLHLLQPYLLQLLLLRCNAPEHTG